MARMADFRERAGRILERAHKTLAFGLRRVFSVQDNFFFWRFSAKTIVEACWLHF